MKTKGKPGKTLKIEGMNLRSASVVDFGSTRASFQLVPLTNTLSAVIPSVPPGTYPVTVTTAFGTSTPTEFTVK
jgi:hypothetical protein